MAFPDDPRDLEVAFAFGHNQAEDPAGLTYEVVAPGADDDDPGDVKAGVVITHGRIDDNPTTDPAKIVFALRNEDGAYSRRNVSGPHYGELKQGTPMQIRVDAGSGMVVRARAGADFEAPRWDGPDINDRVNISALGILARLGRDRKPLAVANHRWVLSQAGLIAFWPGDTPVSLVAGAFDLDQNVPAALIDGWSTATLVDWLPPGYNTGNFVGINGASADLSALTHFAMDIAVRGRPQTDTAEIDITCDPAGAAARIAGDWTSGTPAIVLRDSASNLLDTGDARTAAALWDDATHFWSFDLVESGANTNITVYLDGVEVLSGTETGNLLFGGAQSFLVNGNSVTVGQIAMYADTIPSVADRYEAFTAFHGETASDRITRLCSEEDFSVVVTAGVSAAMGPQMPIALLDLLRECEAADHGILCERVDGRLGYEPLSSLYNQTVALELDYGTEAAPGNCNVYPIDDDRDLYNIVTVRTLDGTEATAEEADGPVGTDEIGDRPLPPLTLNLATGDQAAQHASWVKHETTIDKPRWQLVIDLRATPGIIADWLTCRQGSRITVANPPAQHGGPDDLDLIVVGWVEAFDADVWTAVLHCEPYDRCNVGTLAADSDAGRLNTRGSVTAEALDTTETGVDVTNSDGGWSNTSEPYNITIGGEEMTVTDGGTPGTSQTLTVTRSVNGIVKSHSVGAAVELVHPLRLVL